MIEYLRKNQRNFFFRGHTKLSYTIEPGISRAAANRKNERNYIYGMISEHPSDFEVDRYTFDKLVRSQHYEVPTRLLDLSSNALIGLYFACLKYPEYNGRVLIFKAPDYATKYFMSDCVSCASNLAHLSEGEKHEIVLAVQRHKSKFDRSSESLISFGETDPSEYKEFIESINKEKIFIRLCQFIREEKPHFTNDIDPNDLYRPYIVYPKKNNARISAQSGAFILFGLNMKHGKTDIFGIETHDIIVDGGSKKDILMSLSKLGIHEGSVFPEMDKTAHRLVQKFSN